MNISQEKNRTNHDSQGSCPLPLFVTVGGRGGEGGQRIVLAARRKWNSLTHEDGGVWSYAFWYSTYFDY